MGCLIKYYSCIGNIGPFITLVMIEAPKVDPTPCYAPEPHLPVKPAPEMAEVQEASGCSPAGGTVLRGGPG